MNHYFLFSNIFKYLIIFIFNKISKFFNFFSLCKTVFIKILSYGFKSLNINSLIRCL